MDSVSFLLEQIATAVAQLLAEISLSHTLLELVKSALPLDTLVELLKATVEALPQEQREEQVEALASALLEAVDALQLAKEDAKDLVQPEESERAKEIADKAVKLARQLVVGARPINNN